MTVTLKKGADKKTIERIWARISKSKSRKGLDAKKYCGTVKFKEDGLVLQKKWRSEWS